jgi:hypothetical protein
LRSSSQKQVLGLLVHSEFVPFVSSSFVQRVVDGSFLEKGGDQSSKRR